MATPSVGQGEPVARTEYQALARHGFGSLDAASYLMGRIEDPERALMWLKSRLPSVSDGATRAEVGLNLAFTCAGLARLGLPSDALRGFSRQFREGMVTENRQRILGDLDGSENDPAGWDWGGRPDTEVHVLLLVYASAQEADAVFAREREAMASSGITVVAQLGAMLLDEGREHFGFRDGIAQPEIHGHEERGPNELQPGELFLGHIAESGQISASPTVAAGLDTEDHLLPVDADVALRDLGLNGSYLVFRQLEQDVSGFWNRLAEHATDESGIDRARQVDLASKMVG